MNRVIFLLALVCLSRAWDWNRIAQSLWEADENRAHEPQDYKIDLQIFVQLLDNYNREVGVSEDLPRNHDSEVDAFLNAVMKTKVMQKAHNILLQHGLAKESKEEMKELLKKLWFTLYRRRNHMIHYVTRYGINLLYFTYISSSDDTSAFEHVFVGEIKKGSVSGFHNWLQYAHSQDEGELVYYGYVKKKCENLIAISFEWMPKYRKKTGSILFGVSPEFEMALYTLVFMSGRGQVKMKMESCKFSVTCHKFKGDSSIMGTCYAN